MIRIEVPEADLEALRVRTRWPEVEPVDDRSHGTPLGHLRPLCEHRATFFRLVR